MSKKYSSILLVVLLTLIGSKGFAQCPDFFDFQGNLSATPQYVSCNGAAYNLNLIPELNIGNYTINWGDGSPTTTGNGWLANTSITHNYAATVANYTVTITLPDVPCVVTGNLIMEEPSNASIQIPFGGLTSTCAPGNLDFTNSSTDVSINTVFTWDFGDGSPILTFNNTNAGQTITHTYQPTTVNCQTQVILTAENVCNTTQGGQSTATFGPIRIWDIDDAAITASATLLCYPDTQVTLENTTDRNCFAQGNIAQRYEYWNLGDYWGQGTDSIIDWTAWPPTFPLPLEYPGIGTYTAMLVDSSFCGRDTAYITIQIVPPPTANLSIAKDTICQGENVSFNNLSGGGANTFFWNFGDGSGWNALGGATVNHTYNFSGDFTIQIAAFIGGGTASCTDTATIPLHVLPSPAPNFNFDNNNGCDSLTVSFTDFSSVDVVNWNWNFDNGNTSILQTPPTQFYNASGNYNVKLSVSSANGCSDSLTRIINVFESPVPAFSPTSVCQNDPASFVDLSTSAIGDPIITWGWDFGDGNSSVAQNPTHTYLTAGMVDVELVVSTAFCSAADTIQVTVETVPVASFTADVPVGCAPLLVNFTNTSTVNAVNFSWDFGDGDTTTMTNPTHVFQNNFGFDTTYTIQLIAQTLFGCVDTTYETITVLQKPTASFTDDAVLNCAPLIVSFNGVATPGLNYEWDFGDGTPFDNSQSPIHTYNNLTQFQDTNIVRLVVTSANGCTDTAFSGVIVYPEPVFNFTTAPDSGCSPLLVNFPFVGLGIANSWEWDFGDGSPNEFIPNPTHSYINTTTNNLPLTVQLIASSAFSLFANNPASCIDTSTAQVLVFPNPTAQFTSNVNNGCSPLPVNFTNTSIGGTFFHWDFDDGDTSNTVVPIVSHIFNNTSGSSITNNVMLIAETDKGCRDTAFQNIDVYPEVIALYNADTLGCSPLDVDFTDVSVGNVTNYSWDFGDGSPVNNNQNPSHQYINNTGADLNFVAILIIESNFGCFDTIQKTITVYGTPVASFLPTPLTQTFPNTTVAFNNTSSPGGWQYSWNFGDLTTSVIQAPPNHVYSTWGVFPIELIVSSINCADTFIQTIEIIPPVPVSNFQGPASGCRALEVQFTNTSEYGNTYLWDFGDGGTSTQFEPSYTYFNPGVYTVTLTVFGDGGQDVEAQQSIINVYQLPNAFFTVNPTTVFIPTEPILLYNLSNFASSYLWDFGDGNTSVEEFPEHFYTQEGVYDIMLIASTPNNCIDTFILSSAVEAKTEGDISFPNAFTPNENGGNGGLFTNGDTDNDVFHPIVIGAEEYELNIFNKWGELLFVSKDVNIGWDGYYRNELSKQDVYIYKVNVKYIDGRSESFVGDITLLR
ncbi:MAG: PKD domain-containing protein [Vicingaceae bacterium]|nr:PKD domain-containing protein [Vicingaceae bacterium]